MPKTVLSEVKLPKIAKMVLIIFETYNQRATLFSPS